MELVPVSLVPTCATKWVHKAVKDYQQWVYCKTTETEKGNKLFPQWWLLSLLLIQLNLWSQNVSRPWRELQRRYKSDLRSTKHDSPHRTIEAPRTPRFRGGGRTNARCLRDFAVLFLRVLVCLKRVFSDGQDVKYDRDITPRLHLFTVQTVTKQYK